MNMVYTDWKKKEKSRRNSWNVLEL